MQLIQLYDTDEQNTRAEPGSRRKNPVTPDKLQVCLQRKMCNKRESPGTKGHLSFGGSLQAAQLVETSLRFTSVKFWFFLKIYIFRFVLTLYKNPRFFALAPLCSLEDTDVGSGCSSNFPSASSSHTLRSGSVRAVVSSLNADLNPLEDESNRLGLDSLLKTLPLPFSIRRRVGRIGPQGF